MPKFKPHKGLKKRVTVSAKKKVRFKKSFAGHLMSGTPGRHCQRLRKKNDFKGRLNDSALRALGV